MRTPSQNKAWPPDCYGTFEENAAECSSCVHTEACIAFVRAKILARQCGRTEMEAEVVGRLAAMLTEGSEVPDCMEFKECDCGDAEELRAFDRAVFRRWPDRLSFIRPMLWFERAELERQQGVIIESNHVVVVNVGNGIRMKYPALCAEPSEVGGEDGE